jgi:UDP-N-acetylmuramyl pentapeptide phosphotransferase/UDP-N-acetylglucosamine-1-phosphate transferase
LVRGRIETPKLMILPDLSHLLFPAAWALAAALSCAALIALLRPLLVRYALARPNARSSHTIPTPQGGGIAVVAITAAGSAGAILMTGTPDDGAWIVLAASIFLAVVGAVDDLRPIPVTPRLVLQALAAAAILYALPPELRVLPMLPAWCEDALLLIGLLWFVNLVNFMDGLDWMTVVEAGSILVALTIIGLCGMLPPAATLVAIALGGALLGFAPFNRPVAKLFLGDVGSLPIGLLIGWLLILLASHHLAAALLLPLYYLGDATLTLLRRLSNGEQFWQAHRSHFYQRATDNGFSVLEVITRVLALNVALALLAAMSIMLRSPMIDVACLAIGCAGVGFALQRFSRPRIN